MPLGAKFLLAGLIVCVIFLVYFNFRSNRIRFSSARSTGRYDWIEKTAFGVSCVVADIDLKGSQLTADDLCVRALQIIGVVDIKNLNDVAAGWLRPGTILKLSSWVPQEVGVRTQIMADGRTRFVCSSRPQYSNTLSDFGRSRIVANLVAKEIESLANNSRDST